MIPAVSFADHSASLSDCLIWLGKSVVAGELIVEAREDLPAALRVAYRVSDEIANRVFGPQIWGASEDDVQIIALGESFGIESSQVAGNIGLQLLLMALAKLLEKYLADRG